MPTRKQRRRREKGKRHEYEIVYVDDEGNEVEVEPEERVPHSRKRRDDDKPTRQRPARGTVQPPSWARTAKRSLIFAPIMFATVLLISPKSATIGGQILQTLILLALFLPFSYFLDSMLWRAQQRRLAKPADTRPARKR